VPRTIIERLGAKTLRHDVELVAAIPNTVNLEAPSLVGDGSCDNRERCREKDSRGRNRAAVGVHDGAAKRPGCCRGWE
jgi:hypothetical protein